MSVTVTANTPEEIENDVVLDAIPLHVDDIREIATNTNEDIKSYLSEIHFNTSTRIDRVIALVRFQCQLNNQS